MKPKDELPWGVYIDHEKNSWAQVPEEQARRLWNLHKDGLEALNKALDPIVAHLKEVKEENDELKSRIIGILEHTNKGGLR